MKRKKKKPISRPTSKSSTTKKITSKAFGDPFSSARTSNERGRQQKRGTRKLFSEKQWRNNKEMRLVRME